MVPHRERQAVACQRPAPGHEAPALWYLAHVSTPQARVGGTLPGVPFIVIGRNDRGVVDDDHQWRHQDLFVERIARTTRTLSHADRESAVRCPRGDHRGARGSAEHPRALDAARPGDFGCGEDGRAAAPKRACLRARWAALSEENATARAGFAMNRARKCPTRWSPPPAIPTRPADIVYADSEGRIGFVAPALVRDGVPTTRRGAASRSGLDAKYDWQGFLAYEDLPATRDGGKIVPRTTRSRRRATPTTSLPTGFRRTARKRIRELLAAHAKHSRETFARSRRTTSRGWRASCCRCCAPRSRNPSAASARCRRCRAGKER